MNIDWLRMVKPQSDGHRTHHLKALLSQALRATRSQWYQALPEVTPCFIQGRVKLTHAFGAVPSTFKAGSLEHPHLPLAEAYLSQWPEAYQKFPEIVWGVHPVEIESDDPLMQQASFSGSNLSRYGLIYISMEDPLAMAEAVVHEMTHTKLFALGIQVDTAECFLRNAPEERYYSPVVDSLRPIPALLHAVYSFIHILELDNGCSSPVPMNLNKKRS